jgi:hypothetical protein
VREFRVRNAVPRDVVEQTMKGRVLTDDEYSLLVTNECKVYKPDGAPLLVYLPGALDRQLLDSTYEILHELRKQETDNRGPASGYVRGESKNKPGGRTQMPTPAVASAIIGSFDPYGPANYCRLTAWSGAEWDKYERLFPLFRAISREFQNHVTDRFIAQQRFAMGVDKAWRIKDTVFTTITVNNSYSTGVHVDAGDLTEGFGNLAVLRYGKYRGGRLVFPEYGVAVDMQHGDVLLMDVHSYHGNTQLVCEVCDEPMKGLHDHYGAYDINKPENDPANRYLVERISIVCYARAKMDKCGTAEEELEKARVLADKGSERGARFI